MYEKEMIAIDNFKQKFVFVKIHNLLPKGCKEENKKRACTLGFWRLNIETCKKADYVLGLVDSEVVTIFRVDESSWFNQMKEIGAELRFAPNGKLLKKEPENYIGSIADVAEMLRIALTSKKNSPNLYYVMLILGKEESHRRIDRIISIL